MKVFDILMLSIILCLLACQQEEVPTTTTNKSPNILLIIADDMGKDATTGFSEGSSKPNTPNINNIKQQGITFNNCWVYPTCSPTRASIITGKYGYRTGIKWAGDELSTTETTLQQYINQQTNNAYATAIIGKWHLSGNKKKTNPESFGIDYYTGFISGTAKSYYEWTRTEDTRQTQETDYITTKFTDLSIDWIKQQSKPWFLWLAYTAPHTPFHAPPAEMHSQGNLPAFVNGMDELPYYLAAIEAMDYQIGRLLDSMTQEEKDNTVIIFIGDNGTPNQVAQFPYSNNKSKGSLYQGGINTPLYIAGKGVNRKGVTDNNLVNSTDLYMTIANIAGISLATLNDSKSLLPLFSDASTHRSFQYVEKDNGTDNQWAINNGQYKLIINTNGEEEMYDLTVDPYENNNLLDNNVLSNQQSTAKTTLTNQLAQIRK